VLVSWPFYHLNVFPKWSIVPPSVGIGYFICFFSSSFGWASSYQLYLWEAQFFWTLWFFFFMPLTLFGHFWWLRIFFYAPSIAWTLSITEFFFIYISLALAPYLGSDPSQGYFQKMLLGSKGDCKGYILASWKNYQRWPFFIPNSCT
jgi:hypothetical protein